MATIKGKRVDNYKPVVGVPPHILESDTLNPIQKELYAASEKAEAPKRGRSRKSTATKPRAKKVTSTQPAKGTAKTVRRRKTAKPAPSAEATDANE